MQSQAQFDATDEEIRSQRATSETALAAAAAEKEALQLEVCVMLTLSPVGKTLPLLAHDALRVWVGWTRRLQTRCRKGRQVKGGEAAGLRGLKVLCDGSAGAILMLRIKPCCICTFIQLVIACSSAQDVSCT